VRFHSFLFLENYVLDKGEMQAITLSFLISSQAEVAEVTVTASLKVTEVCLENLNFREDVDLICLAIKLLFSSIQQRQNHAMESQTNDEEKTTDGRDDLKEECVRKLSEKVGSKIKRALSPEMPEYYRSDALSRELEV